MAETQTIGKALAKKILIVQQSVTNIPKRGKNTFHKYDYVLAADAVDHVRQACNTADLVITPIRISNIENVRELIAGSGAVQYVTRVTIAYQIMDPESGEAMVVEWQGEGADGQDKGLNKAYTVCFKYFIMQFFMVAGGDMDPENSAHEQQPGTTRKPRQQSAAGRSKSSASTGVASAAKIKYITDLLKSEWIPGTVRTGVSAWLTKHKVKESWPDNQATKTIDELKKYWPVGSKDRKSSTVTDKQLVFIEKLIKSNSIPKNLRDKIKDEISNHRQNTDWVMSREQASAMIESCEWQIATAKKKQQSAGLNSDQKQSEKQDVDAIDNINELLDEIDAEYSKHIVPGGNMQEQAFKAWRTSHNWTAAQCEGWLADIKGWALKDDDSGTD